MELDRASAIRVTAPRYRAKCARGGGSGHHPVAARVGHRNELIDRVGIVQGAHDKAGGRFVAYHDGGGCGGRSVELGGVIEREGAAGDGVIPPHLDDSGVGAVVHHILARL